MSLVERPGSSERTIEGMKPAQRWSPDRRLELTKFLVRNLLLSSRSPEEVIALGQQLGYSELEILDCAQIMGATVEAQASATGSSSGWHFEENSQLKCILECIFITLEFLDLDLDLVGVEEPVIRDRLN